MSDIHSCSPFCARPECVARRAALPVVGHFNVFGNSLCKGVPQFSTDIALVSLSDATSIIAKITAERDEARAEAHEQARCNGMGSEREAALLAQIAELKSSRPSVERIEAAKREARQEALNNFKHEHGQDFADAKKWREWMEAQRLIEEGMPEGYSVILECSPGDWSLRFTDPEGNDIRIDDYESTEHFIRQAVAAARAALLAEVEGKSHT